MSMDVNAQCLFCRIARAEIPADVVLDTDRVVAFRDIDPKAPTHVLVIPKDHHANLAQMSTSDPELAGLVLQAIAEVVKEEGLTQGYRTVFNTGTDGGQSVDHVHAHVLGGRSLTWPPG